jgi:hypothetical protein
MRTIPSDHELWAIPFHVGNHVTETLAITKVTLAITVNALKACKGAYDLFQSRKDALKQWANLPGLCQVLGVLQISLTTGSTLACRR